MTGVSRPCQYALSKFVIVRKCQRVRISAVLFDWLAAPHARACVHEWRLYSADNCSFHLGYFYHICIRDSLFLFGQASIR